MLTVNNRTAQRGGTIRLKASSSFDETFTRSVTRIKSVINSKLDDFFELSEYNWVPTSREEGPNMYLYELVNWLTTVVDSQLLIASSYIDEAYMGAAEYIAECFMVSSFNLASELGGLVCILVKRIS